MPLTPRQASLFAAKLIESGGSREHGWVYSPNKKLWFNEANPWDGDIDDFIERMTRRCARMVAQSGHFENPQDHKHVVHDHQVVVFVLIEVKEKTS